MDLRERNVQLEMDKFGMEKELSKLKTRLVEREIDWLEYQSFKLQLLGGKAQKEYFANINQEQSKIHYQLRAEKSQQTFHKQWRHHAFFAGMLFSLLLVLSFGWYSGYMGIQSFGVKEFSEPSVFLDKQVYKVGEPVYIHILPKDTPYMLTIIDGNTETTPTAQIFTPLHPGEYQAIVMVEWKGILKKFEIPFKVG